MNDADDPTAAAFARVFLAFRALRDAAAAARLNPDDDTEWVAHMDAADAEIEALRAVLTADSGPPPEEAAAPAEPRPHTVPVFGCGDPDGGVAFGDGD